MTLSRRQPTVLTTLDEDVTNYWPKGHALEYWKKVLASLEARVETTKLKIAQLSCATLENE